MTNSYVLRYLNECLQFEKDLNDLEIQRVKVVNDMIEKENQMISSKKQLVEQLDSIKKTDIKVQLKDGSIWKIEKSTKDLLVRIERVVITLKES
ncbi:hypothetical protein LCGC14_1323730 [marine sediment metagenome]|uniref:Uncharacterized protein n=1 Tax=marine sediment metagenome TaxID=412755 RepID=A0A0F9KIS0_9ZZZZ